MSAADGNLFATQQHVADQRMRGVEMQTRGMERLGDTAMDTVRYIQQLQMRKQELDFRTQSFQVEQAVEMEKLRQMQAIDMTTQSRLQLDAMRAQNKLLEAQAKQAGLQADQQERGYQNLSPSEKASADYGALFGRAGLDKKLQTGELIIGPEGGPPRRPKSQDEAAEWLRRVGEAKRPPINATWHYFTIRAKNLQSELQSISDELEGLRLKKNPTMEELKRRESLQQRKDTIEGEMRDLSQVLGELTQRRTADAAPVVSDEDAQLRLFIDEINK